MGESLNNIAKNLKDIAKDLKNNNKKVQLIYAFNGTGKTRLSKEFKTLITSKNNNESDNLKKYCIITLLLKTSFIGIIILNQY